MKIAAVLTVGAVMLTPNLVFAQSASSDGANRGFHTESTRAPHAAGATAPRPSNDSDRAIDAELRRIDRMMTICTGC